MKEKGDTVDIDNGGKLLDYAKVEKDYGDNRKIQWRIERISMNDGGELLRVCYWELKNTDKYEFRKLPPALDKDIFIDLLADAMKKGIL